MYSLDVNLLRDRPEYKKDLGQRITKSSSATEDLSRIYWAIGAALALPALAGGVFLILQYQNSRLESQIGEIDSQLNRLGIEEQQLQKIQAEANAIKGQNKALASVFNQIRPWSAMLQDLRDRIPPEVQIQNIKQTAPAPPPPAPAAQSANAKPTTPPPPVAVSTGVVEISGMAQSFTSMNDFLLTLQQSPFFKPKETKIVTAELVNGPIPASQLGKVALTPIQFVKYTIQSSLSDIPASELIGELERQGTVGLVTRIRTLQERGIIQK